MIRIISWYMLVISILLACNQHSAPSDQKGSRVLAETSIPGPACIVYKTRADYSHNVAIQLSEDKSRIVSFPDVTDIRKLEKRVYPTPLENGYLLDNRGIGPDVAYISLTWQQYADLPETPTPAIIFKLILDADPILEMYDCGVKSQYAEPIEEMNRLIRDGEIKLKKRLK
jgi:hypothetical protein